MQTIKVFWEREIIRFLFVGGINTVLGFISFSLLIIVFDYWVAITIGYILGIVISYLLNSWIVFRKAPQWRKLFQFPIVYIVQYLINLGVVYVGVEFFTLDEQLAYIIAIIVSLPFTFGLSRLIIKRKEVQN